MSGLSAHTVRGEIEGSRPLQFDSRDITLSGWCLIEKETVPPVVRMVAGVHILSSTGRNSRPDVARLLPGQPGAVQCGFSIAGRLPNGVHVARFEAQLPDQSWQVFKTLTVSVVSPLFVGAVDFPLPEDQTFTQRVHVQGWALHLRSKIKSLSLRYGHQEIAAPVERERNDIAMRFPETAHAVQSGFKSAINLSAGIGPLRLKAILDDGTVSVAHTDCTVDIRRDENHGPDIDWDIPRAILPAHTAKKPAPVEPTEHPLNILFVLHGNFSSNSALHVAGLADELSAAGHACLAAVPHQPETLAWLSSPRFRGASFDDLLHNGLNFPNGRGADIVHAWTTRENVRQFYESVPGCESARLFIHLEDNEQEILSLALRRPYAELIALSSEELALCVPRELSHPHHSRSFLARASGVTVIMDKLREFVPAGIPVQTLWPAADARFFHPQPFPAAFRKALTPEAGSTVLFYHGNVHAANAAEMRELYLAVLRLNEAGHAVRLIRCGLDRADFIEPAVRAKIDAYVWELGLITHHHLPPLMALADIFVQPGAPDPFNDYRFPSKLPEFFAIGRPVILPRTNLGHALLHGTDAYILDRADAAGIAGAILTLRNNPELYEKLRLGAEACAARLFSWRRSATELANFYHKVAG